MQNHDHEDTAEHTHPHDVAALHGHTPSPAPADGHEHAPLTPSTHSHEHGPASPRESHGHEHAASPTTRVPDGDDHGHDHDGSKLGWLRELVPFMHGHKHGGATVDAALESSSDGIAALRTSLIILAVTAGGQLAIVALSGSVALLGDTIHNFSDAATAVPLWIAFILGRRAASRRYTYGYGRAEDVAGVVIILVILASALLTAYESYARLVHPHGLDNVGWVIAAAIGGFIGNEWVAMIRISAGKRIGSAALVADGQHARVDGITSLAVLVGAIAVVLGFERADPIVGLIISVVILFVVKDTVTAIWRRMMDAIEPDVSDSLTAAAESAIAGVAGLRSVSDLRVRWLGHRLQAELSLTVDETMSTRKSHDAAEAVRHAMFHARPELTSIIVHVEPDGSDAHGTTGHHQPAKPAS